jgi:predicted nucleic acid-binding protein
LNLLVDTSVWSLALRRDAPQAVPEVGALGDALQAGRLIVTTGVILQELLQGFAGPRARDQILGRFAALPLVAPDRRDHVEAAGLRNACRRAGLQLGMIDALLAQICIRHGLELLTTDQDFHRIVGRTGLRVWRPLSARL